MNTYGIDNCNKYASAYTVSKEDTSIKLHTCMYVGFCPLLFWIKIYFNNHVFKHCMYIHYYACFLQGLPVPIVTISVGLSYDKYGIKDSTGTRVM